MHTVLLIGDPSRALPMVEQLVQRGYAARAFAEASAGLKSHRDDGTDLVLVVLPVNGAPGREVMAQLRAQDPRALIIVTGKDASVPGAPTALECGAADYLVDAGDTGTLLSVISVNMGARHDDHQLRYLRRQDAAGSDWRAIVAHSPTMRQVLAMVRQICERTATGAAPTILLTGETGTGKGLIAKAIHYSGVRRSRGFVAVNCAAIPAQLMETELFGHVRGAFTDARSSRPGLFEVADRGTLFLDEIGALAFDLQSKLLTAIEQKTIRRIGAADESRVDVQVVAATNRDLADMVRERTFRDDLYHRLNIVNIHLPPLRERGDDCRHLAEALLKQLCAEYGLAPKQLSDAAIAALERYSWPGNVRELRNQIERIVLLHNEPVIEASFFQFAVVNPATIQAGDGRIEVRLPEQSCSLELLERAILEAALAKHEHNVSRTARYLDITRQTLISRLRKHGLRYASTPGQDV
jgi:two-component system, NtrC family, response regulator AtoC